MFFQNLTAFLPKFFNDSAAGVQKIYLKSATLFSPKNKVEDFSPQIPQCTDKAISDRL